MIQLERLAGQVALAGIFCTLGCTTPSPAPVSKASAAAPAATPLAPPAPVAPPASPNPPPLDPLVVVAAPAEVVTLQAAEPRYAPPASLKQFRFPQKNQRKAAPAETAPANPPIEVAASPVATVTADGEAPRYKLPDSLKEWGSGRKVPLYEDPEAAPWQASPTEPRLQNAAVSCNYKDEGGVRGKIMLLIDDFKLTRFNARIEMPNGGVCQFDSKKMEQRPFEQGVALSSKGDECVVRMWEQKHRITIAAYSCHKQCSKGSFSYLWPILMDTRIGTCY